MNGECKHYIQHLGSEELFTDFLLLQNVLGPRSRFEHASCVLVWVAGLVLSNFCYCQMGAVEDRHFLAWWLRWFGVKKGQGLQLSCSSFYPPCNPLHPTHHLWTIFLKSFSLWAAGNFVLAVSKW